MKGDGTTKPTWHIVPESTVIDIDDSTVLRAISRWTYMSALNYWVAYASAKLQYIHDDNVGGFSTSLGYAMFWFMRSIIPSLYNTSLDASGFPITPGDFHSQNIMVTDTDSSSPCITAVTDWERSGAAPTSSFAQYPLFIVDHLLKKRNVQDQVTFDRFMLALESRLHPGEEPSLSQAFASCRGLYLFEQCMHGSLMFSILYEDLFVHIFGEKDEDDPFSYYYHDALVMGTLKEAVQLEKEAAVRKEAVTVLGKDLSYLDKALVSENADKFAEGEEVHSWLATWSTIVRRPYMCLRTCCNHLYKQIIDAFLQCD
ncbi:hypothetical protein BDQ12DRAFT_725738 [Crucibulum laeve]|uniref:Uncharacterized protein n=1 Tax=Crucibulum laeve TaxID=68775 RepID=A0A5C3LSX3_9AGAR|nr:hypothetical protein BDQ12DRAFT_725738 [Crucibulum laeve]